MRQRQRKRHRSRRHGCGSRSKSTEKKHRRLVKADKDKVSYIIGLSFGRQMKSEGIDLKADSFMKGFKDSLSGAKPAMSDEEMQQIMMSYQGELAAKKEAETKKIAEENKKRKTHSSRRTRRKRASRPCRAACSTRSSRKAAARSRRLTTR